MASNIFSLWLNGILLTLIVCTRSSQRRMFTGRRVLGVGHFSALGWSGLLKKINNNMLFPFLYNLSQEINKFIIIDLLTHFCLI